MANQTVSGTLFKKMVTNGAVNLKNNLQRNRSFECTGWGHRNEYADDDDGRY